MKEQVLKTNSGPYIDKHIGICLQDIYVNVIGRVMAKSDLTFS